MAPIPSPVPAPALDAVAPDVSRDIYGMPMFVDLAVRDIDATVAWYTGGLGFISLFALPGPDRRPALVHLRRWQFQDLLVRPAIAPGEAGTSMAVSFAAVYGELEALAERARAHGGGTVEGPIDTAWNTRDVRTIDPDGHVVVFTAGRPPELADPAFSADIVERFRAQEAGAGG